MGNRIETLTRRELLGIGIAATAFKIGEPLVTNAEHSLEVIGSFGLSPESCSATTEAVNGDYSFDAIVVLGAGVEKKVNGYQPNLYSKMRLIAGAAAFRVHLAPRLVLLGEANTKRPALVAYLERKYQKKSGDFSKIPSETIILKDNSFNTASDMYALAGLVRENGWEKVAIFTNDYHLQRVRLLARSFGVNPQVVSVERVLIKRDPRFARVIEEIYSSDEMARIRLKEFLEVLEFVWDPRAVVPTWLAKFRARV